MVVVVVVTAPVFAQRRGGQLIVVQPRLIYMCIMYNREYKESPILLDGLDQLTEHTGAPTPLLRV